jgi:response regulator RpfG family c-di-GMP phosphodiesterase
VDVYDAHVGIIHARRGTHFDPDVVDAFEAAEREIEALSKTRST